MPWGDAVGGGAQDIYRLIDSAVRAEKRVPLPPPLSVGVCENGAVDSFEAIDPQMQGRTFLLPLCCLVVVFFFFNGMLFPRIAVLRDVCANGGIATFYAQAPFSPTLVVGSMVYNTIVYMSFSPPPFQWPWKSLTNGGDLSDILFFLSSLSPSSNLSVLSQSALSLSLPLPKVQKILVGESAIKFPSKKKKNEMRCGKNRSAGFISAHHHHH